MGISGGGLRAVVALSLTLVAAGPARLAASEAVDTLLFQAQDGALRARLLDHARSAPDTLERGEAWYYAGMSYERAAMPDSAILCYQQAIALRGEAPELEAFADASSVRGAVGDVPRALDALRRRLAQAVYSAEGEVSVTEGRIGWAWYVAERGDSALYYLRRNERRLIDPFQPTNRIWRYRLGATEFEFGDSYRAMEFLSSLAVDSNFQDGDVMNLLQRLGDRTRTGANLERSLRSRRQDQDALEQVLVDTLRARRLTFQARDGFPLGGVAFVPGGSGRSRAAILVVPHDEPLQAFDSLAVTMRAAGYSLLLLDLRGWGHSVARSCPLPESWRGRERQMLDLCAGDVRQGLRALAQVARVDTSRYLVLGVGASAPVAALAAASDSRVRALVLIGPDLSPVDRGAVRAALTTFGRPVFFEVPAVARATVPVVEALYQATDMRASRISESDRPGDGARVFRYDRGAFPRIARWLDETWAAPPRKGASR